MARSTAAARLIAPERRLLGRLPQTRGGWLDLGLRLVAVALLVEQFAAQALLQHPSLLHPTAIGSDPANYYAAGQRLNLGHPLYGPLQPGDIPVPDYPSIYPAPLLSPPFIAVAWRPLALLPFDVATTAWWAVGILLTVALVLWCTARGRRTELLILIAVLILGLPIAYLRKAPDPYLGFDSPVAIGALSGNINVGLTALLAIGWWTAMRAWRPSAAAERADGGHAANGWLGRLGLRDLRISDGGADDSVAGSAVAVAAAFKLTPLSGFVWLASERAWPAVLRGIVALAVLGLVGLVGAGIAANLDYVRVALAGHVRPTLLSLPGIASTWLHLSVTSRTRFLPFIAIPVGLAATWLLRHHPRASLAAAILTSIWGSPVVYPGNFMLLLALATPAPLATRVKAAVFRDEAARNADMIPARAGEAGR